MFWLGLMTVSALMGTCIFPCDSLWRSQLNELLSHVVIVTFECSRELSCRIYRGTFLKPLPHLSSSLELSRLTRCPFFWSARRRPARLSLLRATFPCYLLTGFPQTFCDKIPGLCKDFSRTKYIFSPGP